MLANYAYAKILIFTILAFLFSPLCLAQGKFEWLKNPSSFGDENGYAVYVDMYGSVYSVGSFSDTLIFANQTFISQGGLVGSEGVILKYDSLGNEVWAKIISSFHIGETNYCVGIEGDSFGNIYVLGGFTNTAHFGTFSLVAVASVDGFLTKLDSSGNFLWAFQMGGLAFDYPRDLKVNASGKSTITGSYARNLTFGSLSLSGYQDEDVFTGSVDGNGQAIWVKRAGSHGVGDKHDYGNGIDIDSWGNCYVTGMFKDTSEFDSIQIISNGDEDIFIAKYDSSGNLCWAKRAGGGGNLNGDAGVGVAIYNDTSIFILGQSLNGGDFGSLTFHTNYYNTTFISEMDTSGNFKRITDISDSYPIGKGKRLLVNESGELYFIVTPNYNYPPIGHYKVWASAIVKLDTSFNLKWVKQILNLGGIFYKADNLFTSSIFGGTDTIDNIQVTSKGWDILTGKLHDASNIISGTIFKDVDGDSTFTFTDMPILGDSIYLQQYDQYLVSDSLGYWQATIDTGIYNIYNITPHGYSQSKPINPDYYTINFATSNQRIDSLDFALINTTSISEYDNNLRLEFYPNPLQNISTLKLPIRFTNAELRLFDSQGRIISSNQITGDKILIFKGNLSNGIYLIQLIDGNRQYIKKIAVQ